MSFVLETLDKEIDSFLLSQNWEAAKTKLTSYSECLVNAQIPSNTLEPTTKISELVPNQNNLRERKCYYSVCMAETTLHLLGDVNLTVDFLRRALVFKNNSNSVRILAAKLLLISFRETAASLSKKQTLRQGNLFRSPLLFTSENLQLLTILGEQMKDLSVEAQQKLSKVIDSCSLLERQTLLSVFASFSPSNIVDIIKEFEARSAGSEYYSTYYLKYLLVVSAILYFLSEINPKDYLKMYQSGEISGYQYWQYLDATNTRVLALGFLNEIKDARDALFLILKDVSSEDVKELPEQCIQQLIIAACNFPLMEGSARNYVKAMQSFESCLKSDGVWRSFLPISVVISLTVYAAIYRLQLAREVFQNTRSSEDHNDGGSFQAPPSSKVLNELVLAFSDLKQIYHKLLVKTIAAEAMSSSHIYTGHLEPSVASCLGYFPDNVSLPCILAENLSPGIIGLLMSAIFNFTWKTFKQQLSLNIDEDFIEEQKLVDSSDLEETVFSLCSWGYHMELKPSLLTLWNISNAYYGKKHTKEALVTLKKCCEDVSLQLSLNLSENMENSFPVEHVIDSFHDGHLQVAQHLEWLGSYRQIVTKPWISAIMYAEIVLANNLTESIEEALDLVLSCLLDLFGSHAENILHSIGVLTHSFSALKEFAFESHEKRSLEEGLGDKYSQPILDSSDFPLFPFEKPDFAIGFLLLLMQFGRLSIILTKEQSSHHTLVCYLQKATVRLFEYVDSTTDALLENSKYSSYQEFILELVELKACSALHYAVALADVKDITRSLSVANSMMQSPWRNSHPFWTQIEIKYLHLNSLLITVDNNDPKNYALAISFLEKATSSSPLLWNERLSLITTIFYSGERRLAVSLSEALFSEIREWILNSENQGNLGAYSHPSFLSFIVGDVRSSISRREIVSLLIELARLLCRAKRFSLSKQCLYEAWKYLYSIDQDTNSRLLSISQGSAGLHEKIDTLKHVPTLLGWRLPEGTGWAAAHEYDLEAEILADSAYIIQSEENISDEPRAIELFNLALSTFPQHIASLNGLSAIYYKRYEIEYRNAAESIKILDTNYSSSKSSSLSAKETECIESSITSQDLSLAHYYARCALLAADRGADSWNMLSVIYTALGNSEGSLEASITALECERGLLFRTPSVVL